MYVAASCSAEIISELIAHLKNPPFSGSGLLNVPILLSQRLACSELGPSD